MNTRQVRGIAALIAASGFAVGSAGAQPIVIDWLAPATGLWSDPINWAEGNVPDSLDEIARLAPEPGPRGLDVPAALVDGSFEVDQLTGNGVVGVVIQDDFSLSVGELIAGIGSEPFVIVVGDDSLVGGGATLETLGTGGTRGGQTFLDAVTIELADEDAQLVSSKDTRIEADAIVTGAGRLTGTFFSAGLITARNGDTLALTDAVISGGGQILADLNSKIRIEQSEVRSGSILAQLGDVEYAGADIRFSTLGGPVGRHIIEGASTFSDATIASGSDLVVRNRLRYEATDGIFLNEGTVVIEPPGRIDFDDTPDNALLIERGRVVFSNESGGTPFFRVQDGDELYLLPSALIEGSGVVIGDVVNLGRLQATVVDPDDARSTLEIRGDFTQLEIGTVTVGLFQTFQPVLGEPVVQSLLLNSGDVMLGGELNVRYLVIERDRIAGEPFRVVQHRNPNGAFGFEGEFDEVTLNTVPPGLSRIPLVEYAADGVDVTLFCLADVNRNAVVDGQDFGAWILAYNQRDPLADQNQDGTITPADFNAWIDNFNGGCGR